MFYRHSPVSNHQLLALDAGLPVYNLSKQYYEFSARRAVAAFAQETWMLEQRVQVVCLIAILWIRHPIYRI